MSASVDNQMLPDFHNSFRYGLDAQAGAISPVAAFRGNC